VPKLLLAKYFHFFSASSFLFKTTLFYHPLYHPPMTEPLAALSLILNHPVWQKERRKTCLEKKKKSSTGK